MLIFVNFDMFTIHILGNCYDKMEYVYSKWFNLNLMGIYLFLFFVLRGSHYFQTSI